MAPDELREALKVPFQPFRLVMTDGESYDVYHPDLLMVGLRTAVVGLTGSPGQILFERSVRIDLLHIVRLEPLEQPAPPAAKNAPA